MAEAPGIVLSIVARISDEFAVGLCEVALRQRYIGKRDSDIARAAASSSFAASDSIPHIKRRQIFTEWVPTCEGRNIGRIGL